MRNTTLVILLGGFLGGSVWAQALVEHAAAAAGGSVGGVAGKKVGESVNKIFNKIDGQTSKAAETGTNTPLLQVGPGVPKPSAESVPPPPPPAHHAAVRRPATPEPAPEPIPTPAAEVVPVPPPPPPVTAEDLKKVAIGMNRADLLKLGAPSSRITMSEDDHLVEIYRYMEKEMTLGVVRLTDGAVSTVQRP
jgi:hypothetical protein